MDKKTATQLRRKRTCLQRVKAVQDEYLKYKREGVSTIHIYRTYIGPRFCICERSFRSYLAVNAKKGLSDIERLLG